MIYDFAFSGKETWNHCITRGQTGGQFVHMIGLRERIRKKQTREFLCILNKFSIAEKRKRISDFVVYDLRYRFNYNKSRLKLLQFLYKESASFKIMFRPLSSQNDIYIYILLYFKCILIRLDLFIIL